MSKKKVLIIGAGNIGVAIARLLPEKYFHVMIGDTDPEKMQNPLLINLDKVALVPLSVGKEAYMTLEGALESNDYVINAGPHHINEDVIGYARTAETHYFDLSEDVESTEYAKACGDWQTTISKTTAFVPQCGLAPGYVSILANDMAQDLDEVSEILIRVGALPLYPHNRLKYNLTWSTEGLVNEYLKPGLALEGGELVPTSPLSNKETLIIDGTEYEAFSTSGGIGTLHETWDQKAQKINYKTMRYPGHLEYVKFLIEDMQFGEEELVELWNRTIPTTVQDKVIIRVTVIGTKNGKQVQETKVQEITGKDGWTAIQLTTAAGVCGMIDLHLQGKISRVGFVKQEEAQLSDFLGTEAGKVFT